MRLVRVGVRTNLERVKEERDGSARAADDDAALAFLREPLMQFLALGALLFVAHRLFVGDKDPERLVVVPRSLSSELAAEFRAKAGREPDPGELSAALEKWKRDEVAYREGMRLGLDKNDPVVRERVANKLREIEAKLDAVREPSDEELDAWLAAHRERYDTPARFDFEHYFASKQAGDAEARARRILTDLTEGRTPDDVGDSFVEGRQVIGRSEVDVKRSFGPAFELGLEKLELDRWTLLEVGRGVSRCPRARQGSAPLRDTRRAPGGARPRPSRRRAREGRQRRPRGARRLLRVRGGTMKRGPTLMALFAGLLLFLFARPSAAHELRPAALAVSEVTAGRFVVRLTPSANVGFEWAPEVRFPASCRLEDALLDCQPEGLNGELSIASFPSAQSRVIARVKWLDGRELLAVLTSDAPSLGVRSERSEGADRARLVLDYTKLGVEHILTGVDHLLFVLGLLLLVRFGRRLVWTISAFTLAHSLTLSAAVLGLVTVPQARSRR